MALQLEIKVENSEDCGTWYFSDVTPHYSAAHTGGYFTPNLDPNDIDTATMYLAILKPDGTTVNILIDSAYFSPGAVTSTGLITAFPITAADLGYTDVITDGVYKITYKFQNYTSPIKTYRTYCYTVQMCTVCCCIKTKLTDLRTCSTCNQGDISRSTNQFFMAYLKMDTARYLAACGDYDGAQEEIEYLQDYCNSKKCSNC